MAMVCIGTAQSRPHLPAWSPARAKEGNAVTPGESLDEAAIRLVGLPHERTGRVTGAVEHGQVQIDCAREGQYAAVAGKQGAAISGKHWFLKMREFDLPRSNVTASISTNS